MDLSEYDIHLTAVLLKKFFRELPETLIPSSLQNEIEEIKSKKKKEEKNTFQFWKFVSNYILFFQKKKTKIVTTKKLN